MTYGNDAAFTGSSGMARIAKLNVCRINELPDKDDNVKDRLKRINFN